MNARYAGFIKCTTLKLCIVYSCINYLGILTGQWSILALINEISGLIQGYNRLYTIYN